MHHARTERKCGCLLYFFCWVVPFFFFCGVTARMCEGRERVDGDEDRETDTRTGRESCLTVAFSVHSHLLQRHDVARSLFPGAIHHAICALPDSPCVFFEKVIVCEGVVRKCACQSSIFFFVIEKSCVRNSECVFWGRGSCAVLMRILHSPSFSKSDTLSAVSAMTSLPRRPHASRVEQ